MDDVDLKLSIAEPLRSIDSELWDKLAGTDNPFLSHAFLSAIEEGGAVGGNSGWNPMHVLLKNKSGHLMGAMPFYLKYHSYGEYIFDQSWADALNRAGGSYYPKLLCAVPFTPVSGPRFLALNDREDLKKILANGVIQLTNKYQLSSAHINFIQPGDNTFLNGDEWLIRSGLQFHWYNDGYKDFDDFLANLSARKRKYTERTRSCKQCRDTDHTIICAAIN